MAEEFCHYWSGKYPSKRSPVLTKIIIAGVPDTADAVVPAGGRISLTAVVGDGDAPLPDLKLKYIWKILAKDGTVVIGPVETDRPSVELETPRTPGRNYFVMAVVADPTRRASGFTVPFSTR